MLMLNPALDVAQHKIAQRIKHKSSIANINKHIDFLKVWIIESEMRVKHEIKNYRITNFNLNLGLSN